MPCFGRERETETKKSETDAVTTPACTSQMPRETVHHITGGLVSPPTPSLLAVREEGFLEGIIASEDPQRRLHELSLAGCVFSPTASSNHRVIRQAAVWSRRGFTNNAAAADVIVESMNIMNITARLWVPKKANKEVQSWKRRFYMPTILSRPAAISPPKGPRS